MFLRLRNTAELITRFDYDAMGNQIAVTNGEGEKTKYRYDLDGNNVEVRNALNLSTFSAYDAFHNKLAQVDGNGNTMTWSSDQHGRVLTHKDLGGNQTSYVYNGAGQLRATFDTTGGANTLRIEYTYDGALLTMIDDKVTGTVTTYAYDLAGHRVREKTTAIDAITGKRVVAQNNFISYDQQGRMTRVADGLSDVRFTYDANGNRTEVKTTFVNGNTRLPAMASMD